MLWIGVPLTGEELQTNEGIRPSPAVFRQYFARKGPRSKALNMVESVSMFSVLIQTSR